LPFARARLTTSWKPAVYPKELKDLTDHLQKRRIDLGLQWKEVAEQLAVDSTTLTNWTKRRTQPDLRCLPRVIRWLGYDPRPKARTIGEALVRYREGKGASQRQLAKRLAVDPSTLARWERGKRIPSGDYLARIKTSGI
jgi:transcriptional regulator with XRE-family HTH domain